MPAAEMQLKMSKKIAQLTKVIYHLNTKNEDHEATIKALAVQHEGEVSDVLQEAAEKIRRFKEELAKRQEPQVDCRAMEELEARFEAEKETALKEFTAYKHKVASKEEHIKAEFKSRVKAMQKELRQAKEAFEKRVEELQNEHSQLSKEAGDKTAEKLRKAHKKALADQAQEAADRYESMLEERQAAEAALEERLLAAQHKHAEELHALQAGHDASRESLEAQLAEEKERALERLEAEARGELASKEQHFVAHIEELKRQLADAQQAQARLEVKLENEETSRAAAEASISELLLDAERHTIVRDGLEVKLHEAEERLAALEHRLAEQGRLASARARDLQTEVEAAKRELAQEKSERVLTLNKAKERAAQVAEAKSKCEGVQIQLRCLAEAKGELEAEVQSLKKALHEATSLQSEEQSQAARRITDLETQLSATKQASSALQRKLGDLEARAQADAERQAAEAEQKLADAASAKAEELALARAQYDSDRHALEAKHREAVEELHGALEAARQAETEAGARIAALEGDRQSTVAQLEEKLAQSQAEIAGAQKRVASLSQELEAAQELAATSTERLAKAQAAAAEAESQREAVQEALAASTKAHEEALSREAARGKEALRDEREQWRKLLEAEKASHSKDRTQTIRDMEHKLELAKAELAQHGAARVRELEARLQQAQLALEAQLAEREATQGELAAKLRSREAEHIKQLESKEAEQREAEKTILRQHEDHMRSLQEQHKSALSDVLASGIREREALAKQMQEETREALNALRTELLNAKGAEVAAVKRQASADLESLRSKLQHDHQRGLADQQARLERERERILAELNERQASAVNKLNDQLAAFEKSLAEMQVDKSRLEAALDDARSQHASAVEQASRERERLRDDHTAGMDRLRADHAQALRTLEEKFEAQRLYAEQRHKEEAAQLHADIAAAKETIRYWEHRYEHREPRPEDVQHIEKLSRKLESAKEKSRRAAEEMEFYKRELVNREQSYNKVFNRSPHVGVMQVVKSAPGARPEQDRLEVEKAAFLSDKKKEKKRKKKDKKRRGNVEFPPLSGGNNHNNNKYDDTYVDYGDAASEADETRSVVVERPRHGAHQPFSRRLTID